VFLKLRSVHKLRNVIGCFKNIDGVLRTLLLFPITNRFKAEEGKICQNPKNCLRYIIDEYSLNKIEVEGKNCSVK
jgi:hypothetical protein